MTSDVKLLGKEELYGLRVEISKGVKDSEITGSELVVPCVVRITDAGEPHGDFIQCPLTVTCYFANLCGKMKALSYLASVESVVYVRKPQSESKPVPRSVTRETRRVLVYCLRVRPTEYVPTMFSVRPVYDLLAATICDRLSEKGLNSVDDILKYERGICSECGLYLAGTESDDKCEYVDWYENYIMYNDDYKRTGKIKDFPKEAYIRMTPKGYCRPYKYCTGAPVDDYGLSDKQHKVKLHGCSDSDAYVSFGNDVVGTHMRTMQVMIHMMGGIVPSDEYVL